MDGYLAFAKTGYFSAQRQVDPPWQDYAWLADVALVPPDANVTTIDFTSAQAIQVARGSVPTDADGSRQAAALFAQGTQAEMVWPDGTTQPISTLNVRATEYTVGERGPAAMPGKLPPASGYTYALEYSVDEALAAVATDVRFSKPAVNYVENFLGFPVGSIVPTGYYDRQQGAWVASENGRVIQILTISNGLANVDSDGDVIADNDLGLTDAERQQLATLYQPGQSLWRVPLTHFTPWDHNWPFGPPADARPPDQPLPFDSSPLDIECQRGGSIIACQSQTLGETVPVAGTPYDLYYQSNRVLGRSANHTIRIPLTVSGTLPPRLERIDLQIFLAGRRFDRAFTPAPDQVYTFVWDGKDFTGNDYTGTTKAVIRIGYVYREVYNYPTSAPVVFAQYGGDITPVSARSEVIVWQRHTAQVSNADTLSHTAYYKYDALSNTVVITDANGAVTQYLYDGLNRVQSVQYLADGTTVATTYDALGTAIIQTYDLLGNRTHVTYPTGEVVTSTYDGDNRLLTVTAWDGGLTEYEYDDAGHMVTMTLPNGVQSTALYDQADRLTQITHAAPGDILLGQYQYQLDGNGLAQVVTETLRSPEVAALNGAFLESSGLVVMEAEHGSATAGSSHTWQSQTTLAGYGGDGYQRALPDVGALYTADDLAGSPHLAFPLSLSTPLTYTVWVRGMAPDAAGDSLHVGINDRPVDTAARLTGLTNEWSWSRLTMDNAPATVPLTTTGSFTVNVWMLEDGLRIDRLLLVTDTNYTARGHKVTK